MSFANENNFISSLPMCILLISFSYPVTLARASSTMLKGSGESCHLAFSA